MARTVRLTKGQTRYIDFAVADSNYDGGASFQIAQRGSSSETNVNPVCGLMVFDDDEIKSIIGGKVTALNINLCLADFNGGSGTENVIVLPPRTASGFPPKGQLIYYSPADFDYLNIKNGVGRLGSSNSNLSTWTKGQYISIPSTADNLYDLAFYIGNNYGLVFRPWNNGTVVGQNDFFAWFNSFKAADKTPYIEFTLEEVPITVQYGSPIGTFIDRTSLNTFTWKITYDGNPAVIGSFLSETAKFRWRMAGETDYEEVSAVGDSYTAPAFTFGNGAVEWQVEVTSNAGTVTTSPWYTVTTIDTDAIASPISPDGVKINREDEALFTWSHTTTYGTNATASDLQYSTNALQWYDLASVEGSELSVTVPPDTLPIGTVYWRVRTYNANGVAGAWSEAAAVTVAGKVPPPVIASVTTATAAPEIRWSAQLQQAYEAQILSGSDIVYQSGTKLGTEKTHKVKALLPDGEYTAKVRVYAENGEVSDWAEYSFIVSTEKPITPTISAQPVEGGVKLLVTADTTVYILRDGEPVGIVRGGEYTDYGGAGQSVYVARAVTSQGTYSDSRPVTAGPLLHGSVIAPADNLAAMTKLYLNLNDNPKREMTWSPVGSMSHYAGRKYPMYEYTEQEDESYNYSFAFREAKEYQAFMELVKKRGAILYRDQYGVRYYGVITGVSPGFNWGGYAVSFSVTRVDHKEGIEYDV